MQCRRKECGIQIVKLISHLVYITHFGYRRASECLSIKYICLFIFIFLFISFFMLSIDFSPDSPRPSCFLRFFFSFLCLIVYFFYNYSPMLVIKYRYLGPVS